MSTKPKEYSQDVAGYQDQADISAKASNILS